MSTPVTQYSSPDPSLYHYPDFGQFTQYLITGTNYIVDSQAQKVFLFTPPVPGQPRPRTFDGERFDGPYPYSDGPRFDFPHPEDRFDGPYPDEHFPRHGWGVLENTEGSYAEFMAFILANPVTSVLPNPNGPPGGPATFGFPYHLRSIPAPAIPVLDNAVINVLENILLELRCIRLATVKTAVQDGSAIESDFDPTLANTFVGQ